MLGQREYYELKKLWRGPKQAAYIAEFKIKKNQRTREQRILSILSRSERVKGKFIMCLEVTRELKLSHQSKGNVQPRL